jgi:membrane protein implicated in regulation of membrane protease activity
LSFVRNRFVFALIAYAVLAALAFATLSEQRIRTVTLAILAMFAIRTWVRRKDAMHPDSESGSEQ